MIYAGGVGPDGQYYDPDGTMINVMEYIRRKYIGAFNKASGTMKVKFANYDQLKIFAYWYTLNNCTSQGWEYRYDFSGGKELFLSKNQLTDHAGTLSEESLAYAKEDAEKIKDITPFSSKLQAANRLTHDRMPTYDASAMTLDTNDALKQQRGVCFHYSQYLKAILDAAGIESTYELGDLEGNVVSDAYHVWNVVTDPETGKKYRTDPTNLIEGDLLVDFPGFMVEQYKLVSLYNIKD